MGDLRLQMAAVEMLHCLNSGHFVALQGLDTLDWPSHIFNIYSARNRICSKMN